MVTAAADEVEEKAADSEDGDRVQARLSSCSESMDGKMNRTM